jgi:hypothetical protein
MDAERMLFAGSSLDKARAIFTNLARKRPRARLTIRQRTRVLNGGQSDRGSARDEAWRMASNIAKAAGAAETAQHWPPKTEGWLFFQRKNVVAAPRTGNQPAPVRQEPPRDLKGGQQRRQPWPQKTKLNRYYASQNGLQVSLNASCGV